MTKVTFLAFSQNMKCQKVVSIGWYESTKYLAFNADL